MHRPTEKKTADNVVIAFTVSIDLSKVARGHQSHRGGAGKHKHKCVSRLGTRNARNRAALND